MSDEVLYLVIPAYNEEETIESVVQQWHKIVENHNGNNNSRLVVFNDGSKDETLNKLENIRSAYPFLEVVDKQNSGHGSTIYRGYLYALENGADYIFQTDSDGQTDPAEFEEFWNKRNEADVIIGRRCHREDGAARVFVSMVLKLVLRILFSINIIDANAPFRLMNRTALAREIKHVPADFNLTNVLLTVLFIRGRERVLFIPITFRPRQGGVNSLNFKSISKIGLQSVRDFMEFKTNHTV